MKIPLKKLKYVPIALILIFHSIIISTEANSEIDLESGQKSRYGTIPNDNDALKIWGQAKNKKINPEEINLLSWNIYKASLEGFQEDFKELSSYFDLILTQEFADNNGINSFWMDFHDFRTDYAISFFRKEQSTGVATFSKIMPISSTWIRSYVLEPITRTPKMILITSYEIDGHDQNLYVANIHGLNFTSTENFIKQLIQLENAINHHNGPLIVAGDFNTRNAERSWAMLNFAKRLNLKKIKFSEHKIFFESTKLDHILVRGLHATNATVLEEITSSDHKPLSAQLQVIGPSNE